MRFVYAHNNFKMNFSIYFYMWKYPHYYMVYLIKINFKYQNF